mmetsp:Transcript_11573/g.11629  ORF Transcript_11573/g.11629 Transcript_11573/m.11629 type:complete len:242 (+) Transcript_11573:6-731(+)
MEASGKKGNIFALLDDDVEDTPKPKSEVKKGSSSTEKQAGQSSKSEGKAKESQQAKKAPAQPRSQQPMAPIPSSKETKNQDKKRREAPGDDRKQRTAYRGKDLKRDGAGGHNWGKATDLPGEEPKEEVEAKAEDEAKEEASPEEGAEKVEEQPKEQFLTLDEYFGTAKEEEKTEEEPKDELLRFRINKGNRRKPQQGGYKKGEKGEGEKEGKTEKKEYRGPRKNVQQAPNFADSNAFPALA